MTRPEDDDDNGMETKPELRNSDEVAKQLREAAREREEANRQRRDDERRQRDSDR
ncbi:MAG: hypothetical protein JWL77_6844 [Chthonomonadaceae bacterium]|nr:hypothetical protein [Chthonomonadaceae bacterium]